MDTPRRTYRKICQHCGKEFIAYTSATAYCSHRCSGLADKLRKRNDRLKSTESDHREELPDYPERAVTEVICNAIIHRDYQELGSEIHIDIYDDRMEVYSPRGMIDGRLIQQLNPLSVPSKRRNPLLADFFSRLDLMERQGKYGKFYGCSNYPRCRYTTPYS